MLMIPGPIEIHPDVIAAYAVAPPSHVSPPIIEAFGASLSAMRQVWGAADNSHPFVVAGSGTLAMDMAVGNLIDEDDGVLLVNTGYFSDRMAEMLERRGARVTQIRAAVGQAPHIDKLEKALQAGSFKALFVTHVDTSTGVRIDAQAFAKVAHQHGLLSIFDGVCATAAETFRMEEWGADVYLTSSQKAIGLPVGLAMLVVSERAMARRRSLRQPPPMSTDWLQWHPIMQAYEARKGSYFSTPATNLLLALKVALGHILDARHGDQVGIVARFAQHRCAADAMRAAWREMNLTLLCAPELAANTLSAIRYPDGVGSELVAAIKEEGVVVAGGLHPDCRAEYFRVGHMGYAVTQPQMLLKTVGAIATALNSCGHAVEVDRVVEATRGALSQ